MRFVSGVKDIVSFKDVVSLLRMATYEYPLPTNDEPYRYLFLGKVNSTQSSPKKVYEILVRLLPDPVDGSFPRCEIISCERSLNVRLIALA